MSSLELENVDVIIIGAGPTGLMLACQLSLYGIRFRIFDKSADHTTQSRALVVHARSLEIFDQLGLADEAISRGEIGQGASGFFNGRKRIEIDMNLIRTQNITKYPFMLILEQSQTEELLEEFLVKRGIKIDRQCELIDFVELNDGLIECTIKDIRNTTDERLIKIRTKYLCGCDGAHSKVRKNLQLSFTGNTYQETLFVLDCHVKFFDEENISNTATMQFNMTRSGFCLFFRLKNYANEHRYRVIGTIPHHLLNSINELKFEDIQSSISQHIERKVELYDEIWMSIYRTHHRHVETFSVRNKYFLVGDAAHIHSPVGGQGMNTGLQDAFNLGWKLAFNIQDKVTNNDELLKTYNEERLRVAMELVHSTDRAFAFVTNSHWFIRFVRIRIIPYLYQYIVYPLIKYISYIRDGLFKRLSMLAIHYRLSSFSIGDNSKNDKIQPGDRMPYISTHPNILPTSIDNYDRLCFHFFILINPKHKNRNMAYLFIQFIENHYSDLIQVHQFEYSNETKEIFDAFAVIKDTIGGGFLIRPDQYIAYSTKTFHIQHFTDYFSRYFQSKNLNS